MVIVIYYYSFNFFKEFNYHFFKFFVIEVINFPKIFKNFFVMILFLTNFLYLIFYQEEVWEDLKY